MDEKIPFTLTGLQGTLLVPLWGRARETKKKEPLFVDKKAVEIFDSISYDSTVFTQYLNKTAYMGFIARSIYFDDEIKKFIKNHPTATIVNIGCGLDTTFDRIDNGTIQWIDLDFPEVIDFRRKFISESDRRIFVSDSVFNLGWYEYIKNKNETMFLMAGVLEYFSDQEISQLLNNISVNCPGVEILFEYCSKLGMKAMNKSLQRTKELIGTARIQWSLDKLSDITKIYERISIINNMTMYKEHKKKYKLPTRLLLSYFDFWKISSLAHVKVD
jgi:O-methyltransferase involved in polyketide biosynthesis